MNWLQILSVIGSLLLWSWCPAARGDGGTLRVCERAGPYQVTVFTAPTPLRAGPLDISVFVQDAATAEPLSTAQVMVRAIPRGHPEEVLAEPATGEAATNKLFRAAVFDLPHAGWWEVEVAIDGPRGKAQVHLAMEAADRLPRWLTLWPWFSWPAVAVLLFAAHQWLVRRRAVLDHAAKT